LADSGDESAAALRSMTAGDMESAAALRSMAEAAAAEGLPLELERLGSEGQRELAVRYETSPDELVGVLTERHIDGLLNPLGTATSKLQVTTPASEGRIIADLYWRCCIAMQMSAPCQSNRARLQPGCSRCASVCTPVGNSVRPLRSLLPPAGSATCFAQGASQAPPGPAAALASG